jgi:hypothetical protein
LADDDNGFESYWLCERTGVSVPVTPAECASCEHCCEQKSVVIMTDSPFKQWDSVFPNAACASRSSTGLTHHAEIISIDGESYRAHAPQAQSE